MDKHSFSLLDPDAETFKGKKKTNARKWLIICILLKVYSKFRPVPRCYILLSIFVCLFPLQKTRKVIFHKLV